MERVRFSFLLSETGYSRPLISGTCAFSLPRLFCRAVLMTWTPRGGGAHLSALHHISSLFPSFSLLSSLSSVQMAVGWSRDRRVSGWWAQEPGAGHPTPLLLAAGGPPRPAAPEERTRTRRSAALDLRRAPDGGAPSSSRFRSTPLPRPPVLLCSARRSCSVCV